MSDKLEVWQLCEHGQAKRHYVSVFGTPTVEVNHSGCPGGKRIVLRRMNGSEHAEDEDAIDITERVWVEVSGDE